MYSHLKGPLGTIPIWGQGNLSGLFGPETTFFTAFSTSPIPIRSLDSLLPKSLFPPDVRETIEKLEIDGEVELIRSLISGSTDETKPISIVEEVQISKGRVMIQPTGTKPVSNIQGTLVWDNGKLQLKIYRGNIVRPLLLTEKVKFILAKPALGQFTSAGSGGYSRTFDDLDLIGTYTQDLPDLLKELEGSGTVTLNIQGPLQEPENMVVTSIQLQDWDFVVSQNLPPLQQVSATVQLNKDRLTISGLQAQHGESKILNADSTVQFGGKGPWCHA